MSVGKKMLAWTSGGAAVTGVAAAVNGHEGLEIFEFSVYGAIFGFCLSIAETALKSLKGN